MQEKVEIIIEIDTAEVEEKLGQTAKSLNDLKERNKELRKGMKDGTADFQAASKEIALNNNEIKTLTSTQKALEGQIVSSNKTENEYTKTLQGQRANLNALKAQYASLTEAQKNTSGGVAMKKSLDELDVSVKASEESMGDFGRNVGNYPKIFDIAGSSMGKLQGMISGLGGGAKTVGGMAANAFGAIKTSAISMGKAFLTPPIGLIVVVLSAIMLAVKGVSDAFKKNDDAGTSLARSMAVFKPIGEAIGRMFTGLAVAIGAFLETLASGFAYILQFAEMLGLLPDGFTESAEAAQELVTAQDNLEDAQRDYAVNSAERNRDSEKLRAEALDKEKYTAAERVKLLQQAIDLQKENLEDDKKIKAEQLRLLEAKAVQENDTSDATKDKIAAARAAMYQSEEAYYSGTRRLQAQMTSAQDEINADEQKKVKEAQDKAKKANEEYKKIQEKRKADLKEQAQKVKEINRELEDSILDARKKSVEKDIELEKLATARKIEDLKFKLANENNLTAEAKKKLNELILSTQAASDLAVQSLVDENQKEVLAKEMAAEQKRLSLLLEVATKGSDAELALRLKQIEFLRNQELAQLDLTEEAKAAIKSKYDIQADEANKQMLVKQKQERDAVLNNEFEELKLRLEGQEAELVSLELDRALAEKDALLSMDEQTKAALFASDAEYTAAVLANRAKIVDAEKAVQKQKTDAVRKTVGDLSAMAGAFSDAFEALAGDSEEFAVFQKAMALFNIGLSTADAIAKGVASAQTVPFPGNIIAIATTVAAVVANIASAISLVKKTSAPKFATGGIVGGASYTGDNVPVNVNSAEMILNTKQQRNLFDAVNTNSLGGGIDYEKMASAFQAGASSLPPPNLAYNEFSDFQEQVATIKEISTL